jgi:plastocyanin
MRRCELWLLTAFALVLPAAALSAQAQSTAKTGVVSGTITIDGKPTEDVVVSIEGVSAQKPQGLYYRRAVMEQRDLRFYPYILPILVGAKVDFRNDDKVWHNVYSASDTKKFDLGLYAPGKEKGVTFDKPGVVRVQCNVHPTMEAFIVVKAHPYFATPDREGNYRFAVPLGAYRLTVWHPTLGTRSEPFTLERPDEVLRLDLDLNKTK